MSKQKAKKDPKKKNKGGRPTKYSAEKVKILIKYTEECFLSNKLPTVQGYSHLIDVNTDTVVEWCKKHKGFSVAIKKMKDLQCEMLQQSVYSNKGNVVGGIFLLKNNHGFKDRQDLDVTSKGKELPRPIIGVNPDVPSNNSNTEDTEPNQED